MNLAEIGHLILTSPTLQYVLVGSALLGISSGVLGSFAVLRKQSLLGDALAHAALPGVCIAFILTGTKNPLVILLGALISGFIGTWLIITIRNTSRIKEDAAIGIILSVFFGFGIVLLTAIQHSGSGSQSGLDKFLFGQAASLIQRDVQTMSLLALLIIIVTMIFYKEFKVLTFDRDFGKSLGLPMLVIEGVLTALIVAAVVVGLQTVGIVMMVAMLVTPAIAARQWTDRLGIMIVLAGLFGLSGGVIGAIVSGVSAKIPTGPVIVLTMVSIVFASLLFAPKRGLLRAWVRFRRYRKKVKVENILKDLHYLVRSSEKWFTPYTLEKIAGVRTHKHGCVKKVLHYLSRKNMVETTPMGWCFTPAGLKEARRVVRNHRLWELYLSRKLELPADHVHRDAEDMEHALTPEIIAMLEKELEYPDVDPHGTPIIQPKVFSNES